MIRMLIGKKAHIFLDIKDMYTPLYDPFMLFSFISSFACMVIILNEPLDRGVNCLL